MISANNVLITNGRFNQNFVTSSRGFELLTQNVATRALHDSGQVADPAKCHPDTRVAILTDLQEWADGLQYNYPIKWISGSAGVGKTAIMRTTAETLERKKLLLACFFFWRTEERCNSADFLIATLAYQIAVSIPETRPYIERAVEERPHIFTQKLEVQSQALITDPITALYEENALPPHHARIFVIDGLDECLTASNQSQDTEKQCEVLRTLYWILQQLPASFKVLIASRPEYHIQKTFDTSLKDIASPLVLNYSSDAAADIERFYVDKFREIRAHHPLGSLLPPSNWPSPEILKILVQKASGQFIYASTVIKFVSAAKKNPSHQLKVVLKEELCSKMRPFRPLDVLYSTILSTVDDEDLPVMLRVLGALWISRTPNGSSPVIWDHFFGLQEGEVQRLMLGLESLLLVRGTGVRLPDRPIFPYINVEHDRAQRTFQFYHASLGDFLFDSGRSGIFFIDRGMACEDLAKQSIFHLFTKPLNDDILTHLILLEIRTWFKEANPSIEFRDVIDQAGMFIRPRDLKMRYPMFLKAIKRSRLPDKERVYDFHLDRYRGHMKQVLPLYFQDECLVFLLLSRLRVEFDDLTKLILHGDNYLEEFVDEVCSLAPEFQAIDRYHGLYLYLDPTDREERHTSSRSRFRIFKDSVEEEISKIPDIGHWYAKIASKFVKYLSKRTRHPTSIQSIYVLRPRSMVLLVPGLIEGCLEKASTGSGLIECLKKYPIGDELDWIQRPINEYLRTPREETEPTPVPSPISLSREFEGAIPLWPGIWAGWMGQQESKLGNEVEPIKYNLDIDE